MKKQFCIMVSTENNCIEHGRPCLVIVARDENRVEKKNILFHQVIAIDKTDTPESVEDILIAIARSIFGGETFIRLALGLKYDHLLTGTIGGNGVKE